MRVPRRSTIALATVGALASTGTAYLGARNLLVGQATQARTIIPKSWDIPPRADGVYTRGGGPVQRWQRGMSVDLHLMIFGDSTATGYGCFSAEEVPGVLIARGTGRADRQARPAEHQSDRRRHLEGRVRPGRRDVRGRAAAGRSGDDARRQRRHGAQRHQPVGAAPGLGGAQVARPRCGGGRRYVPGSWSDLRHPPAAAVAGTLAGSATCPRPGRRGQGGRRCARAVGDPVGAPIPGVTRAMFSADGFHPSPTAYALAAEQLLPVLCEELGEKNGIPTVELPSPSRASAPVLRSRSGG